MTKKEYTFIEDVLDYFRLKKTTTMGGNCGTFALALSFILKDKGFDPNRIKIVFASDVDNEEDIIRGEPAIYHIFLDIDEEYYLDGDGLHTNADSIMDWIQMEYDVFDSEAITFDYSEIESKKLGTVIRSNTNYDKDVSDFLYIYQGYLK